MEYMNRMSRRIPQPGKHPCGAGGTLPSRPRLESKPSRCATAGRRWTRFGVLNVLALITACVPAPEVPIVTGPVPPGDLEVTATTDTPEVFEKSAVTLTATVTGGTPPYLFRWNLNAGPEALVPSDVTSPTLETPQISTPGRYVFRVIATDGGGLSATGFVAFEVIVAVSATAPALAVIDEPVELSATVASDEVMLEWSVARGTASFDDPTSTTPMLTTSVGETVEIVLTTTLPRSDGVETTTTQSFEIVSIPDLTPEVLIETTLGDITIELEGEVAPLHTVNFLLYVDEGFFDGLVFHRSACSENPDTGECDPFVLQGGAFKRVDGELVQQEPTRDPVLSEADNGLSNAEINSIAMALTGGDVNSGTTQFFFNLADNGFLDSSGFTVFGRVVNGIEVIEAITEIETEENPFAPPGEVSLPVEDVTMERVSRVVP